MAKRMNKEDLIAIVHENDKLLHQNEESKEIAIPQTIEIKFSDIDLSTVLLSPREWPHNVQNVQNVQKTQKSTKKLQLNQKFSPEFRNNYLANQKYKVVTRMEKRIHGKEIASKKYASTFKRAQIMNGNYDDDETQSIEAMILERDKLRQNTKLDDYEVDKDED